MEILGTRKIWVKGFVQFFATLPSSASDSANARIYLIRGVIYATRYASRG